MPAANFAIFRLDRYGYPHFLNNDFRTRDACKADLRANRAHYLASLQPGDSRALIVANLAWYKRNQDPDEKSEKELRRLYGQPEPTEPDSVVISGTVEGLTRAQCKAALEARGYKVAGAISGKTAALVTGAAPGRNKVAQARAAGVPVIEWEEFAA